MQHHGYFHLLSLNSPLFLFSSVFICFQMLSYTYICFHLLSSAFIHFHGMNLQGHLERMSKENQFSGALIFTKSGFCMNTSLLRASLYDANNARYLQIYGKILFECLNLPLRSYVRGRHSRGKRESGGSFALLPPVET